jgi:hypothetical protein
VFAKKIKGKPTQKLPNGDEDDELIIVVGPPLLTSGAKMTSQSSI